MSALKLTLAGVAITAIASSLFSCNNDKTKTAAVESTATVQTGERIVFVNSDSLLNNYEYFKEVKASIQEKSKAAQADLTAKGDAFQKELADYQRAAQTMSADQRAATEERLGRKQRELQSLNQNASSALANESSVENEKLYDKVAKYLQGYAKDKGYKMVLSYSKSNPTVLFADASLDVTKAVVTGLNEEYSSEKK